MYCIVTVNLNWKKNLSILCSMVKGPSDNSTNWVKMSDVFLIQNTFKITHCQTVKLVLIL